ncbi:MAG TPA: polyphosphate kinase 1 [Puia sp.]|jgi:polyphosphate kinase|nr:polyphosphate kinase 1 [Puia sp.]
MIDNSFFDRDLSWLSFNLRVMEEAARSTTPLLEKINFLSIYSSNLDEFYRVRVPALAALKSASLQKITEEVDRQLAHYGELLTGSILPELSSQGIEFIYQPAAQTSMPYTLPVPPAVRNAATDYFFTELLAFLQPVHISRTKDSFFPGNDKLYFAVVTGGPDQEIYILNIPSDSCSRFFTAEEGGRQYILFIDDIILDNLGFIFPDRTLQGACSIKITRDAELDLEDEYEGDIAEKIEKKLAKRDAGLATRFLHQPGMPPEILRALIDALGLHHASIVQGGRYHNLRDLSTFPVKDARLSYPAWPSQKGGNASGLFQRISRNDMLLHPPYERYDTVLQFFNEAAIDPEVEEIYVTMYRIARDSRIAHALVSASHNGKKVTVFVELKARFDEANNLQWARQMKQAGVKIVYSIPALKVHAKIALVKKNVRQRMIYYGLLATGNLNEKTARFYTDHILLTGNHDLTRELELLFIFLSRRKHPRNTEKIPFRHMLVAQFNLQDRFLALIDREIQHVRLGKPASIIIKLNNLEERALIEKLYEASRAGVTIQLIVRSICCCIPGVLGMSHNIRIIRIVDRYLEHGRVFYFHNNGHEEVFLGSADWMNRNIYRRIEVCFPLYDESLKKEIKEMIRLQTMEPEVRSQEAIYHYLTQKRRDV